jgi:hypothetical protein
MKYGRLSGVGRQFVLIDVVRVGRAGPIVVKGAVLTTVETLYREGRGFLYGGPINTFPKVGDPYFPGTENLQDPISTANPKTAQTSCATYIPAG